MRRIVVAASIFAVLLAAGIAWWVVAGRDRAASVNGVPAKNLPPLDAPAENLIKFAASDDFQSLPADKQAAYADVLRDPDRYEQYVQLYFDGKITIADGRRAMSHVAGSIALRRAREYASATTPEQRMAIVDKAIEDKQKAEEKLQLGLMLNSLGQLTTRGRTPGQGPSPEAVKNWVEKLGPQDRANMAEFLAAVRKRIREQPGIGQ